MRQSFFPVRIGIERIMEKYPAEIFGGEKQQAAVARALNGFSWVTAYGHESVRRGRLRTWGLTILHSDIII